MYTRVEIGVCVGACRRHIVAFLNVPGKTMPKLATVAFIVAMFAAGAPARAGDDETLVAAQNFISSLTELDAALQRYNDLAKAAHISSIQATPLCAALNPDPNLVPDTPLSLSDLLTSSKIEIGDARVLCGALAAERASLEKAKAANLAAASACAAHRVPACDAANEAVAAQKERRAKMDLGGRQ